MAFQNRSEFISAAASEKVTLVDVNAKARLYVFSGPTLSVYSKVVPHFVSGLKQDNTDLTQVNDLGSVIEGTFYYDIEASTLHMRLFGDADPSLVEVIVTYKFFYSSKAVQLPHDLQDISNDVHYEGRVVASPGYKHKIGIDQALTSLIGEGTLQLKNQDGGLDSIFDKLVFENQRVTIRSWNPYLKPSEAKVIYRGSITNKTFDGNEVKLKIKDQLFALLDAPQIEAYTADDNVADSAQGQYKRRVYGRVDGLRCQSTSQVADGIQLTGTVKIAANSVLLEGTGTSFLNEVLQNDEIIVGTQSFNVEEVLDDTSITLSDEAAFGFSGQNALLVPERGSVLRNRRFLAAGHICAEVTHNITLVPQFNRVVLDSTAGLFPGDFIEFNETAERIEIKNVAPGNIVVLTQNMVLKPSVATTITRRPIQEVYIGSSRVNSNDYSIFNTGNECGIVLDSDAEFNLANSRNTVFDATFTNGSRTVSVSNNEVSLTDVFLPGDFIKPDDLTYTTFYKIVNVNDTTLDISSTFVDPTITDTVELISPEYITDESIVSVNILGKTVDGTASGTWIQTVPQAMTDLLTDVGVTDLNNQSFIDGLDDAYQLVSMALPEGFEDKNLPTVKEVSDKLNKSVRSSLTLDNDLLVKYQVLNVYTGEDLVTITDSDVLDWKIKSTNGKTYRTAQVKYRFSDVDLSTQEAGNKFVSHESEFVKRYIGTTKIDELNVYLYKELDAKIAARRHLYYNQLGVATLNITTDLRLENVEIGQVVIADFRRLYKRYGNADHRKKTMLVIGKTLTGEKTELILSDLGNTFNTSSFITPNDAPDFSAASNDEKLIYGFITDNQGITDNDEDAAGIHLIS